MFVNRLLPHLNRNITTARNMSSIKEVVAALEKFAPLEYAESWDNVGLLISPYTEKEIKTIFLTNDLTEPVMLEAVERNADFIISYHPPIFAPMKRITQNTWKERIVSICLEKRIALYSPHTAWDFIFNGVNDYLVGILPHVKSSAPIKTPEGNNRGGTGRLATLESKTTLEMVVNQVKKEIGLTGIQVAIGNGRSLNDEVTIVGICAGSGASVLKGVKADVYLTGEMSHHDLLDAAHNGVSVILCNHSNSERGYLKQFAGRLKTLVPTDVVISEKDADPLQLV